MQAQYLLHLLIPYCPQDTVESVTASDGSLPPHMVDPLLAIDRILQVKEEQKYTKNYILVFYTQNLDQWTLCNALLHLQIIVDQATNMVCCNVIFTIMFTLSHTHSTVELNQNTYLNVLFKSLRTHAVMSGQDRLQNHWMINNKWMEHTGMEYLKYENGTKNITKIIGCIYCACTCIMTIYAFYVSLQSKYLASNSISQ